MLPSPVHPEWRAPGYRVGCERHRLRRLRSSPVLPLICLDVDGTLVGSTGSPSDELWTAAERARGRGQRLTLCTARLAAGATRDWAEQLDPDGWHVFHTGAAR